MQGRQKGATRKGRKMSRSLIFEWTLLTGLAAFATYCLYQACWFTSFCALPVVEGWWF